MTIYHCVACGTEAARVTLLPGGPEAESYLEVATAGRLAEFRVEPCGCVVSGSPVAPMPVAFTVEQRP